MQKSTYILQAQDDLLYTADGRTLIDLFTSHGTVWLGHRRKEVQKAISDQLDQIWITGGYPTPAVELAYSTVNGFLPDGYRLASLASTGMEANEQAFRIARANTGRLSAIGLSGAMHGKSFAMSGLAWDNHDGLHIPQIHKISAGPHESETNTLDFIERTLSTNQIAAVYIEPIHGTSMGWEGSIDFYQAIRTLTRRYESLLIYDEVLTGFFRTGEKFRFQTHQVAPDILVFGKSCGNGFPVGGVAVSSQISIEARMLLGSTFSNNALAAAAVSSSLQYLQVLDPRNKVREIERIILTHLGWVTRSDKARLKGSGAMWVLSMKNPASANNCFTELHNAEVCVGINGHQIRILPSLTIKLENLDRACALISSKLNAAVS